MEERRNQSLFQRWWHSLPDADQVFSYDTVKEVRILDSRLGLIYYTVFFAIVAYIVLFVFLINKQYLEQEKTTGWIVTSVLGNPLSDKKIPFDVYDAVTNPGELGAEPNKRCAFPLSPCQTAEDCSMGAMGEDKVATPTCDNGMCVKLGWCPAEQEGAATTEQHLIDANQYSLWFKAKAYFHKLADGLEISTTRNGRPMHYPNASANTYTLEDLLRFANLHLDDVRENGAVVQANVIFACDLDEKNEDEQCQTELNTALVDATSGFNYRFNHYYYEDGTRKRDAYRMYGVRVVTEAAALGAITSVGQIILQISSALALLGVATMVADFFLQSVVPERNHYKMQKVLETEDFN
ncbi:unnamed protein product [Vitrella brassicaformis CCMP3155]|uniref:P2X purinoceptor n=1 Tax=Vitrella brassicaformis (strain CCMP3155) TaxID=1169540 RepID=A0A0G4GQA6_VITBC|nr:unnamed protein product [Vitrella brassicaformis CCMP3155]|eukprot:CEM32630.1 unnamed protein product [Vitrella brassicaformis CCMP3155]